ncbi:hypothetical protein PV327_007650 [Microctonus hyperodae]|uniref:F-box only protein 22 n=1 Tax=Microctonus hyperodae TaxID=165561 RepID=A0AA39FZM5_MICHY|nr:hypothetical protein PV327_007650 [Microctonus hyperodae]
MKMSSPRSTRAKKRVLDTNKNQVKLNKLEYDELITPKVTLSYDVLRIIFANLLARDLSNATMVCRLWQEVAEYELKHRRLITNLVDHETAFSYCRINEHFSNGLTNKPMLGLFFNGSDCDPPECLGQHLPRSCVSVTIMNSGVIGNNEELESCDDRVAYTLLPDDPKVNIEIIAATSSQMTCINRRIDKHEKILRPHRISYVEPMINDSLKRLKDIKCMLIFTSEKFRHSEKLYKLNIFKNNIKAAWGGVAEKLFICQVNESGVPETQDVLWLTILISGVNVKCWSTLVDDSDETEESVMAALKELKNQVKLQRHTIGFMFACVARGVNWYGGEENVESKIFKKVFPDVPLIGSFGNGEYGIRSHNKCPFIDGLDHQYSTTFMILTYG